MSKRFLTARMPRRAVVALATLVSLTLVSGIAWAYWTESGSGSATASTGTLNPPTKVTASVSAGAVSVGWTASTGTPAPQGYYVTRTNTSTHATADACGSSPTQLLATVSCTDGSVAAGTYTYAVVAVLSSWTATSASSSSVTVPTLVGTTTTLTSSVNPSVVGQKVTYTATVAAQSGTKKPTGTVTFTDSGVTVCANVTVSSGKATCAATYASPGSHSIVATYTPTGSFGASTSTALTQTVNKASTTTTLTSSPKNPVVGQSVTLTAAVAVTSPGSGTPTGTVTFTDAGTTLCTQTLSSASATCTVPFTTASSHSLVATYAGGGSFTGSSDSLTQTVGDASTTTTLTPATASAVIGQTVTFTATVAVTSPGSGTATGSVTFKDTTTGTNLCTGSALSGGVATCQAAFSTVASHKVTVTYGGDADDSGSTSGTSTVTVGKASTSTAVTSSANPSVVGQQVTYTATVSVTAPGSGTPTGTVTFKDGTTTICSAATLSGGQATCAPSTYTSTGSHSITAVYNGDTNDTTSTATALTQTVGQAATSTVVTSSANPSPFGGQVTYTATVSVSAPGSGTPTGTVTFKDGTTTICTAVTLGGGAASCQNTPSTSGAHSITAVFTSGSSNIAGSTSAVLTQTVSSFSQGGVSDGNGDTVLTASSFSWQISSANQFCATIQPTTSSATPVAWSMRIDTTQVPFNGSNLSSIAGAVVTQQPDANGIMYLGGTGSGTGTFDATTNNKLIKSGQYANVSICVYGGNPPAVVAQGSGTYTYSTVLASGASQYYACAVTTVVGYFPTFYVGFQVSVDWRAVLNSAVSAGQITSSQRTSLLAKTLSSWYGGNGAWNVSQSGYVYTAAGADPYNNAGITNGQTITINSCTG